MLLLSLWSSIGWAQQLTIKGTVTDVQNIPVIGATVIVKGTTIGTTTDIDGNYTIRADKGQVLEFSYVGMQKQDIPVTGQTAIHVRMAEGELLDEVVVVGYGTVKKSDLTGAVSSVSGKDLQANLARSASSALQGRIAGVTVNGATGQPGDGMNIHIRGVNSLSNTQPLYVIDGVYGDINMVEPSDIQSINVLKDASAAAIYGSRAANGVVLITTKGARRDMPTQVEVSAYTGVQTVAKTIDVLDGNQLRDVCKQYGLAQDYPDLVNWEGKGTDWQKELYRTAAVHKVAMNVSGGSKSAAFNVSASYLKQNGIVKTTGYEAWNIRNKNTFYLFNNHVRVGNTILLKMWKKDWDNQGYTSVLRAEPMMPVYDNGTYGDNKDYKGHWGVIPAWARQTDNPVGYVEAYDRQKHGIDLLINAYAEVDLGLKGLKYKFNVGINKYTRRNYDYIDLYYFSSSSQNATTSLKEGTSWENGWLLENTVNYDNVFGKHTLAAVIGYSAQKNSSRGFNAGRGGMHEGLYVISAGQASTTTAGGSAWTNSLISMFGRATYSYDDRYMATASVRRDGSSKFARGHRFGVFPSASVGWNIMNESFFESAKEKVNELKIRASYGVLGNLNGIGNYDTQSLIKDGFNYVQGIGAKESWMMGASTNTEWATPATTTWEKTKTWNVGADAGFFNNRLTVSIDYFIQRTDGLLLGINQAPSAGMSGSPVMNAAIVDNKGVEFSVDYRNAVGEFNYHVGLNLSHVNNKLKEITSLSKQQYGGYEPHGAATVTWAKEGDPIGSFYLIKTDGLFQNEAEVRNYQKDGELIQPKAKPGDIRFVDYNNDGQIDADDQQYCGNPFPDMTMGLTLGGMYKGIDFNLFFDGSFGGKIYNGLRYYTSYMQNGITNVSTDVLNSWTESNTNTDIPRFTMDDDNKNNQAGSDRWLEDGSYFRLKTLEIGYTFPSAWTAKAKLQNVRIYTAMENLFTITGYKGYTPDLGVNGGDGAGDEYTGVMSRGCDDGRYPQARNFTFGLQVNF